MPMELGARIGTERLDYTTATHVLGALVQNPALHSCGTRVDADPLRLSRAPCAACCIETLLHYPAPDGEFVVGEDPDPSFRHPFLRTGALVRVWNPR